VLPRTLQIEVISSLPGLAADKDQEYLVHQLHDLTQSVQELIPCSMETISNLCLPANSAALKQSVEHSLQLLASADAVLLPPIIRFLFDACNEDNYLVILPSLRASIADFLTSSAGSTGQALQNNRSTNALLIGIIKSTISSRPKVFELFLKYFMLSDKNIQIPNLIYDEDMHVEILDLWILFSVDGSLKSRAKINNILAKLLQAGRLNETDVQKSIIHHGLELDILFPNILALSQSCVSSTRIGSLSGHSHEIGVFLYQFLYDEFTSGVRRQEIISSLVAHVNSTLKQEVHSAFRILSNISKKEAMARNTRCAPSPEHPTLRQFVAFLKTLLEDILRLSTEQQRMLFSLIFSCTVQYIPSSVSFTSSSSLHRPEIIFSTPDDVMILLKKFAASTNKKTQQVAIVGQVAYICQLAFECKMFSEEICLNNHLTTIFVNFSNQLRANENKKVLFNELSIVLASGELGFEPFILWLHLDITEKYLDRFFGLNKSQSSATPSKTGVYHTEVRCHSLDGLERHPYTVSIASSVLDFEYAKDTSDCEMELLAPVVRLSALLLSNYSKCREDTLLDFFNFLGTPLELPPASALAAAVDYPGRCRMFFWRSLRYASEWTRETLSCFGDLYFVPSGLIAMESTHTIDYEKSPGVETLIKIISSALSVNDAEAINLINEAIACVIVDRLNQLVEIEEDLMNLSVEFPDSVDPLFSLSTPTMKLSTAISQARTAIDVNTSIETQVAGKKLRSKGKLAISAGDVQNHIKTQLRWDIRKLKLLHFKTFFVLHLQILLYFN